MKNVIVSEQAKFWKFISNKVYLDEQRINLDKRLLANYYKNKGYYNVDVQDSFVEFKNSGQFDLIYKIEAGNKFNFNKLNLKIPDSFEEEDFEKIQKLLTKLEGKLYSLNKLEKILDKIDSLATTKSYEFIDAEINETIINENNLDITISFSESEKFYVERVNILGNSITLEEVIRNNLIVDEGDPFNEILFNKSINNLKAKGIFKSVKYTMSEGSSSNLKNIDLKVEEKPTGEISLGAGVGTSGGSIGGGIRENNFLGKGIDWIQILILMKIEFLDNLFIQNLILTIQITLYLLHLKLHRQTTLVTMDIKLMRTVFLLVHHLSNMKIYI